MDDFFRNVPVDEAADIEMMARLVYELRENRAAILNSLGVSDEAELLAGIASGSLAKHPTYESYLSARIVGETREALRRQLASYQSSSKVSYADEAKRETLVLSPGDIKAWLEANFPADIDGEIVAARDAVLFKLANGVVVEMRVLSSHAYAFAWLWGEATCRVDTAPSPDRADSETSHFHDADGQCHPDPVTVAGDPPLENIHRLIKALLANPLLGA
jgi:hypothetical protein